MIPHALTAASTAKTYLVIRSFLPSKTNSLEPQRFRYGNALAAGVGSPNHPRYAAPSGVNLSTGAHLGFTWSFGRHIQIALRSATGLSDRGFLCGCELAAVPSA
jgi:hypothetical protein